MVKEVEMTLQEYIRLKERLSRLKNDYHSLTTSASSCAVEFHSYDTVASRDKELLKRAIEYYSDILSRAIVSSNEASPHEVTVGDLLLIDINTISSSNRFIIRLVGELIEPERDETVSINDEIYPIKNVSTKSPLGVALNRQDIGAYTEYIADNTLFTVHIERKVSEMSIPQR